MTYTSPEIRVSMGENEPNDSAILEECDVCPLCKLVVTEVVDALCCDGPCLTWYHRKCLKISPQKYKQLPMSHQKWFCKTCPSDYDEEDTKLKWGPYTGKAEINYAVNSLIVVINLLNRIDHFSFTSLFIFRCLS